MKYIHQYLKGEISASKLIELVPEPLDLVGGFANAIDEFRRPLELCVKEDGKIIPTGQAGECLIAQCKACGMFIGLPDGTGLIVVKSGYERL